MEFADFVNRAAPRVFNPQPMPSSMAGLAPTSAIPKPITDPEAQAISSVPAIFTKEEFEKAISEGRYFVMRSSNPDNLQIAKTQNEWATTRASEIKLAEAYNSSPHVFLIFSVSKTPVFHGLARMASPVSSKIASYWRQQDIIRLGGCFRLQWVSLSQVGFNRISNMINAFSENIPVKNSKDGTEIDPKSGKDLALMFEVPFREPSKDEAKLDENKAAKKETKLSWPSGGPPPVLDFLIKSVPGFQDNLGKLNETLFSKVVDEVSKLAGKKDRKASENEDKAKDWRKDDDLSLSWSDDRSKNNRKDRDEERKKRRNRDKSNDKDRDRDRKNRDREKSRKIKRNKNRKRSH